MRIAVYNQMFGLDGRKFSKNLFGHYYLHYQGNQKRVLSRIDLNETLKLAGEAKANILGLCEIYEGTQEEIKRKLRKFGYRHFYLGIGHKFKFNNQRVMELVASKVKGKQLNIKDWPLKNTLGGGGGFVVCKFKDFTLFHVHLALPSRGYFNEQIAYLQKMIKNTRGKIILMGDFNLSYKKLKSYFPEFEIATKEVKTCSTTPLLKWFFWKDCDHIFIKGFKPKNLGVFEGRSDHKLIWAEVK